MLYFSTGFLYFTLRPVRLIIYSAIWLFSSRTLSALALMLPHHPITIQKTLIIVSLSVHSANKLLNSITAATSHFLFARTCKSGFLFITLHKAFIEVGFVGSTTHRFIFRRTFSLAAIKFHHKIFIRFLFPLLFF